MVLTPTALLLHTNLKRQSCLTHQRWNWFCCAARPYWHCFHILHPRDYSTFLQCVGRRPWQSSNSHFPFETPWYVLGKPHLLSSWFLPKISQILAQQPKGGRLFLFSLGTGRFQRVMDTCWVRIGLLNHEWLWCAGLLAKEVWDGQKGGCILILLRKSYLSGYIDLNQTPFARETWKWICNSYILHTLLHTPSLSPQFNQSNLLYPRGELLISFVRWKSQQKPQFHKKILQHSSCGKILANLHRQWQLSIKFVFGTRISQTSSVRQEGPSRRHRLNDTVWIFPLRTSYQWHNALSLAAMHFLMPWYLPSSSINCSDTIDMYPSMNRPVQYFFYFREKFIFDSLPYPSDQVPFLFLLRSTICVLCVRQFGTCFLSLICFVSIPLGRLSQLLGGSINSMRWKNCGYFLKRSLGSGPTELLGCSWEASGYARSSSRFPPIFLGYVRTPSWVDESLFQYQPEARFFIFWSNPLPLSRFQPFTILCAYSFPCFADHKVLFWSRLRQMSWYQNVPRLQDTSSRPSVATFECLQNAKTTELWVFARCRRNYGSICGWIVR